MKISSNLIFLLLTLLISKTSFADSQLIDKIYHPYVLANEREIEWRFYERRSDDGTELAQRLGYGFSIGENVTFEAYVIGDKQPSGDFTVHSYEGEIRWMLADQGKYFIDTGLLFEV